MAKNKAIQWLKKDNEKEKHRKKQWRKAALIQAAGILSIIAISIITI